MKGHIVKRSQGSWTIVKTAAPAWLIDEGEYILACCSLRFN